MPPVYYVNSTEIVGSGGYIEGFVYSVDTADPWQDCGYATVEAAVSAAEDEVRWDREQGGLKASYLADFGDLISDEEGPDPYEDGVFAEMEGWLDYVEATEDQA